MKDLKALGQKPLVQLIASMTEVEFLTGEKGGEDRLDIDDCFAKDFDEAIAELQEVAPQALVIDPRSPRIPSLIQAGLYYQEIVEGLGLFDECSGELIGGFLSVDLVLEYQYRGRGLGKEICAVYFAVNRSLPTWWLDDASFSSDGHRAACAAFDWLFNNPEITQKIEGAVTEKPATPATLGPGKTSSSLGMGH